MKWWEPGCLAVAIGILLMSVGLAILVIGTLAYM